MILNWENLPAESNPFCCMALMWFEPVVCIWPGRGTSPQISPIRKISRSVSPYYFLSTCPSSFEFALLLNESECDMAADFICLERTGCAGSHSESVVHIWNLMWWCRHLLCDPSQNGGLPVDLHPQSQTSSVFSAENRTGMISDPLCEPSQNG